MYYYNSQGQKMPMNQKESYQPPKDNKVDPKNIVPMEPYINPKLNFIERYSVTSGMPMWAIILLILVVAGGAGYGGYYYCKKKGNPVRHANTGTKFKFY